MTRKQINALMNAGFSNWSIKELMDLKANTIGADPMVVDMMRWALCKR